MKFLLRNNNGFTLIELMIVVAILGILAAIGLTNFQKYQCKSKQSEAKTHLSNIRTLQEAFRAENDTYTTVLSSLGYAASGDTRYDLVVSSASANSFVITANGVVGDVTGDVWTMTENGTLNNDTNSCD